MAPSPYIKPKLRNGLRLYVNISKGKAADVIILSESCVLMVIDEFMDLGGSADLRASGSHVVEFRV